MSLDSTQEVGYFKYNSSTIYQPLILIFLIIMLLVIISKIADLFKL